MRSHATAKCRCTPGGVDFFSMRRRLPSEPEQLIEQLTAWIAWRYAHSTDSLVLTSAPTSIPLGLDHWKAAAVWRLAWQGNGAAVLYGIAPGRGPGKYFLARHDGVTSRREGTFERHSDGRWSHVEGDDLKSRRMMRDAA
jgi:hypothetical protein